MQKKNFTTEYCCQFGSLEFHGYRTEGRKIFSYKNSAAKFFCLFNLAHTKARAFGADFEAAILNRQLRNPHSIVFTAGYEFMIDGTIISLSTASLFKSVTWLNHSRMSASSMASNNSFCLYSIRQLMIAP
jgi:hypothetical protein